MRWLPAAVVLACLVGVGGDGSGALHAAGSAPYVPPLREVDSDPSWPPAAPRLRVALGILPSLSTGPHSVIVVPSVSARGSFGSAFDYSVSLQSRSERYGRGAGRADNIDVVWATVAVARSLGPVSLLLFANHGSGFHATFAGLIGHAQEYGGSLSVDAAGFSLGAGRWTISPSVEAFRRMSAMPELRFQQVSPGIELRGRIGGLPGVFRLSATAELRNYDDGRRSRIVTVGAAWWRVVHRNLAVGVRAEYARNSAIPRGDSYGAFEIGPFLVLSFSTAPPTPRDEEDLQPGRRQRF